MGEANKYDDIAQRILDATEQLIMRYGYDKTSLEDIAREAGIARSTLYGRWKKKDDVGMALLGRATRRYLDRLLERIEADPAGGTFAALFRHAMEVLNQDPFLLALYRQEHHLLGSMLRRPEIGGLYAARVEALKVFLNLMQQAGTVRPGVDIEALAVLLSSLQYGYIKMTEMLPEAQLLSADRILGVSSAMIDAYTAAPGGDSEAGKAAIRQYFAAMYHEIEKLESKES